MEDCSFQHDVLFQIYTILKERASVFKCSSTIMLLSAAYLLLLLLLVVVLQTYSERKGKRIEKSQQFEYLHISIQSVSQS